MPPFLCRKFSQSSNQPEKCGTKKSGKPKPENMALARKGITGNHARRPAGHGQEMGC